MGGWGSALLSYSPVHAFVVLLLLFRRGESSLLRGGLGGCLTS